MLLSLTIFYSCSENFTETDSIVSTIEERSDSDIKLFNRILITLNENGEYVFANNDSSLESTIDLLFTDHNELLTHVETYGLATEDNARPYFYVKGDKGLENHFIFVYLDSKPNSDSAIGGGACKSSDCCDECADTECSCHDVSDECKAEGKNGKCELEEISIDISTF